MQTTDKSGVSAFIQAAVHCGMKYVVCSPGSRNAPLVIAIDLHPDIETIVIHDERSAAFYAMGMAQQLNAPVGVVCTSGSAMLNYYPAVSEAYYQCIPLVVMSADRPKEWVNHGDGQTIVQRGVYTNHIRFQGDVAEFVNGHQEETLVKDVINAFRIGNGHWKGPIHFNFPLSEPLYGVKEFVAVDLPASVQEEEVEVEIDDDFKTAWESSTRKMILCGQMNPDPVVQHLLVELSDDSSVAVLVENTSNIQHQRFVHCIDRTLSAITPEVIARYQPEVLITLGGAIISKRIKKFLRDADVKVHCRVGHAFPEMDTYRKLTHSIEQKPSLFLKSLSQLGAQRNQSLFGASWKQLDYEMEGRIPSFLSVASYSDLTVFNLLLDFIPDNSVLHMANSSVVRYCQLFNPVRSIDYYANRGTSGIDGSTSTACGAAIIKSDRYNTLITGDVSFFYDSNALWSNHLTDNLRIILINNSGGGIFRIIDGPSGTDQLEKYFEAQHKHTAEFLCKAFGVDYLKAESLEDLEACMPEFYNRSDNDAPRLLEVFTPAEGNAQVLKDFFKLGKMSK